MSLSKVTLSGKNKFAKGKAAILTLYATEQLRRAFGSVLRLQPNPNSRESSADNATMRMQMSRAIFGPHLGPGETIKIRLPLNNLDVVSNVGSLIQIVYGIQLTGLAGYADWQTVFSQYRIIEADIKYTPYFRGGSTNTGLIVAGIDYGTSITNVASFTAGEQLDTSKHVRLCDPETWKVELTKGLGALDWIQTDTNLVYACWKCMSNNNSGVGVSSYYGLLSGHATVEFKGLQ
jgi:hypothetical protein